MATEYIVGDSIVACLRLKAPAPPATDPSAEPWFRSLSRLLRTVCSPHEGDVKLFEGRAYRPFYANNRDPETGCSWTETADGGGYGQVVLAWADQPKLRVRVTVKLRVAKDGRWAWLTVGHNPTSLTVGHNVHPAAFIDPTTGVAENMSLLELGGHDARLSPRLCLSRGHERTRSALRSRRQAAPSRTVTFTSNASNMPPRRPCRT